MRRKDEPLNFLDPVSRSGAPRHRRILLTQSLAQLHGRPCAPAAARLPVKQFRMCHETPRTVWTPGGLRWCPRQGSPPARAPLEGQGDRHGQVLKASTSSTILCARRALSCTRRRGWPSGLKRSRPRGGPSTAGPPSSPLPAEGYQFDRQRCDEIRDATHIRTQERLNVPGPGTLRHTAYRT